MLIGFYLVPLGQLAFSAQDEIKILTFKTECLCEFEMKDKRFSLLFYFANGSVSLPVFPAPDSPEMMTH